jgi:hypothetical protein
MCFVLWVQIFPKGFTFGIKHASNVIGSDFSTGATHHIDHTVDRSRRLARGIPQIRHGMEGSV